MILWKNHNRDPMMLLLITVIIKYVRSDADMRQSDQSYLSITTYILSNYDSYISFYISKLHILLDRPKLT